jgi:hypothetical protein
MMSVNRSKKRETIPDRSFITQQFDLEKHWMNLDEI